MTEINVEKIMQEIREDIERRGLRESELDFQSMKPSASSPTHEHNLQVYAEELRLANLFACVDMNIPIIGSPFVCFCKKIIRKLTRFCIRPIVERQNEFNAHCVRTLNEMNILMEDMKKAKEEQDELIEKLSFKIQELEKKHA